MKVNERQWSECGIIIPNALRFSNLYGWVMPQKLPVDWFKRKTIGTRVTQKLIQNQDGVSNKGCILQVDVSYFKRLNNKHSDHSILIWKSKDWKMPETCI